MATRYVNTASSAGGDGTTNATSGANRAYASLNAWEAARQADLTGGGAEICICEGSAADSTAVTVDGWTTTASDYIEIKVEQANRPTTPAFSTGHYRVVGSFAFVPAILVSESYVRLLGVQVRNTHSSSDSHGLRVRPLVTPANADIRLTGVISYGVPHASARGVLISDCTATCINCLSYGHGGDGFRFSFGANGFTGYVYNCVAAANGATGFTADSSSNTTTIRNCYSGGNTGADYSANWDTASNNHSEDGTLGTTTAYSTSSGAYFTNVTAASENFTLGSSSTLIDAGYDLSGTFTTDILGTTRGATFDVGVYEYVAGGSEDVAAAGNLSITGAAVLNAAGSLVAAGAASITGAADLDAAGSLVAAGALSITGAADLDATGALLAAGSASITGTADLDAIGNLLAAGSLAIEGAADLTGASDTDVAASGSLSVTGSAALNAIGSLTTAGSLSIIGSSDLDAIGQLLAAGSIVVTGAADLTSTTASDISASGELSITGSAALDAIGQILSAGSIFITGIAALTSGTVDVARTPGGSGYPVYWQGKRRKRRLEEQPNLHLKKVLDDVVAELYGELTEDEVPKEVQVKAAKLVKPFVKKTDKKLAIPPEAAVDWQALEKDAARVRQIIALWRKHELEVEIEAEDEYLLMMA